MKRSEIIKQIVSDHEGKYDENTINEILFSLESYGMLPPCNSGVAGTDYEECTDDHTYDHTYDCKWEDEDEKK